jgi:hypothetical protein
MSFRVHGCVVEAATGRPLEGMVIRLYDKDVVLDDFLGESRTGASGRFELTFTEAQFRDVFEKRPDLYLRVYDPSGTHLLRTTEREVRFNAGRDEFFEVRIDRSRVRET